MIDRVVASAGRNKATSAKRRSCKAAYVSEPHFMHTSETQIFLSIEKSIQRFDEFKLIIRFTSHVYSVWGYTSELRPVAVPVFGFNSEVEVVMRINSCNELGLDPPDYEVLSPEYAIVNSLPCASLLAFTEASLDAFLYLNHGYVFEGVMTGNAVLCGVGI